jgi:glycine/D-amino acid oxidase-like deaminating enzyme
VPPWPTTPPTPQERAAYADATPRAFWLDRLPPRDPTPLDQDAQTDLLIVGAGFTGLWAALHAKRRDPGRDVLVVDAGRAGGGASGRNGGFVSSSLTHGIANGEMRFGAEMPALNRLGDENFAGMRADLERHAIACDWEETGDLTALLDPHEVAGAGEEAAALEAAGHDVRVLDAEAMRAEVASPTYRGGIEDRTGAALVDPAKLADGLRAAAARAGVRLAEHTSIERLANEGAGVAARTAGGHRIAARCVLLGTSAYRPLVPAVRRYVAPVYDYVLVTEPLSPPQREAIGWSHRQGISDAGNQFHYYRLTDDDRILWGGYDAVYRFRGPVEDALDEHDASFARLAQHFITTFPQLEDVRFTHRWGGAIDTCSRFSVFFGTALRGRAAYALGYTGLGVASTRFGAEVALDLVDGRDTEVTRLEYVRRKPVPFPPEPLRYGVIQLTRAKLAAADRAGGRRGLWLRTLDRLGLGFDS